MRRKENANDYRYFPDPDLPFIEISDGELVAYRAEIPTLPYERKAQYMEKYGLDAYCAEMLINDISIADYFEKVAEKTTNAKIAANLLTGEVFRLLDPDTKEILISVDSLAAIANMADDQTINSSTAKRLLPYRMTTRASRRQSPTAHKESASVYAMRCGDSRHSAR